MATLLAPFSPPPLHDRAAPLLQLENVTVNYGNAPALHRITLQVNQGDCVAVVGPNGAGKSTLFNVIAGIVKPNSGRVQISGSGPDRHICVGYVPQRNRIDWRFPVTVRDVVMMGRVGKIGLLRWPGRRDRDLVQAALEQVGMAAFAGRQIGELDGDAHHRWTIAVKRTLYFAPVATAALRQIDRRLVARVWPTVETLRVNPDALPFRSDAVDPSVYGVTITGDVTLWFEILDEQHAIRVLDIAE